MKGLDCAWHKLRAWWSGERPSPPPSPHPHALLPRVSVLSAFPGRGCVPAWTRLPTRPGGTRVAGDTALRAHPFAETGVVLQPYQRLLNLCDVSAPRDLWPRFQGLSGDDLTSWAVSLTRGRLGWVELCRPTGGAAHWRPDSGWRRATSPAGRCCGRGEGSRRVHGCVSQALRLADLSAPLHRLLCPALAGRSSCCNNTRSISGSPPAPASSLLSPGVSSSCVSRWAGSLR